METKWFTSRSIRKGEEMFVNYDVFEYYPQWFLELAIELTGDALWDEENNDK